MIIKNIHYRIQRTISFILFSILLFSFQSYGQVSKQFFSSLGVGFHITGDEFGNFYTAGYLVGTNNIGGQDYTSDGVRDVLICKFNNQGNFDWITHFAGGSENLVRGITYDNHGHIWATGYFSGTTSIGSFTLTAVGEKDLFITKIDATNGDILWVGSGGGDKIQPNNIATDANGNIFVSGYMKTQLTYQGSTINAPSDFNAFNLKIDNSGNLIALFGITSSVFTTQQAATMDASGNMYVIGNSLAGMIQYGNQAYNLPVTSHYYAKFAPNGDYLWHKTSTPTVGGRIDGMTVDSDQNIYFVGNLEGTHTFGSISVTNPYELDHNALIGKMDSSGNFLWVKSYGLAGDDRAYDVGVKNNGDIIVVGIYTGEVSFGPFTANGDSSQNHSFVLKLNTDGQEQWLMPVYSEMNYSEVMNIHIRDENIVMSGLNPPSGLTYGNETIQTYGGFVINIVDNANKMYGKVFHDANENGTIEPLESNLGIPNVILKIDNTNYVVNSGQDGDYAFFVPNGNYTYSIPNLPPYYNLTTPASQTLGFNSWMGQSTIRNFGLKPIPNKNDLVVDITQLTGTKPGKSLAYMITCKNVGTTNQTPTLTLQADSELMYFSSSFVPTINGNEYSWELPLLEPNENIMVKVYFEVPTTTQIGEYITSSVNLTSDETDETPTNNQMAITKEVTGPFDPNFKLVDKDTLWDLQSDGWLTYEIHFQNVGNDTAENVFIIDTLTSPYVDVSSIEILAQSHEPLRLEIRNNKILDFRFDNINLPDSTTNEIESNGFVKFRIKHGANLPLYETIDNFVDIYFDYNEPVRTDTATTLHYTIYAGIQDFDLPQFTVYPNPANSNVNILFEKEPINAYHIQVISMEGRVVNIHTTSEKQTVLATDNLPNGFYMLTVSDDAEGLYMTRKIVVQH